jgi:restriction system protein
MPPCADSCFVAILAAAASKPELPGFLSILKAFLEGMLSIWPLWLFIGLLALGRLALDLRRLHRLSKSGIKEVDQMDGRTFEEFLSTLFRKLGYRVELTRYRGDYGADLVVARAGVCMAVQAKRWTKSIGIKAVQEVVAAKGYYGCHEALVVGTSGFTPQARELARVNAVGLWDRERLVEKLLAVSSRNGHTTDDGAPEHGDRSLPFEADVDAQCAKCGVAVTEAVRSYCLARPGRFGGLIYCFSHQRSVAPNR